MPRIVTWTKESAKVKLNQRLNDCIAARRDIEYQWQENEKTIYNTRGVQFTPNLSISFESETELGITDVDQSETAIGVNYAFKNFRLIHSLLSANPPSVVVRPNSNDLEDRRAADAADRLVRYALRSYKLKRRIDDCSRDTLLYGTGFLKTLWNPDAGDIVSVDDEGNVEMEGKIEITNVSPWRLFIDGDATNWEEVRFVFEEIVIPYEQALFMFGDEHKDLIEKSRIQDSDIPADHHSRSLLASAKFDAVRIFQYWERGEAYNGMIGRFCYCTREGDVLGDLRPNPHRFTQASDKAGDAASKLPAKAILPYHHFTDFDAPESPWGRAVLSYESPLQDAHNRMLNVVMDNLQAHGVARLILPEGSEVMDDSITNSPWDIIKTTGSQDPHYMEPMPMPPQVNQTLADIKTYIDDMAGVNESMFGQQSREQSGFSMQYATNQGNMIRHHLFSKYVELVESVYKSFLNLVIKHWDTPQTIKVLGKEKAFETMDLEGADVDGGYDLVVEYGASLSLDPVTRREEIISLMPLFEKAGVTTRTILSMLKLNELEGLYDRMQMAEDRQREIFEEMLAKRMYIPPREKQDHKNMLEFCYNYIMSSEFKYLEPDFQQLIEQHIQEREQIAAGGQAAAMGGPQPPGPPPSMGGMPPAPPEMTGEMAAGPTEQGPLPGNPEGVPE